ncbi:hypothetical protein CLCR_10017 [Cladophialophora carrionii]|uniref:Uncharacterized protein n=1 Tax=Cladophialophora carrionii TaxID=86049 RepID=A0A1C1CZ46_9EURO|nr:hypothetical protein CLCR_10017 [Cladophialophora carrionii]
MTIHKQYPPRNYETFADGAEALNQSPTSYRQGGDADKSRSAAVEARRLASQGSWADNFTGGTPATNRTPLASTVDGDEERDVEYPGIPQDGDPSDPPPVYTPSASTQTASQSPLAPASPVAARSVPAPVPGPVSTPNTQSPTRTRPAQSPFRPNDEEEGRSTLPEAVRQSQQGSPNRHYHDHDEEAEADSDSDTLPVFLQQQQQQQQPRRKWCRGPRKARSCGNRRHGFGHGNHDKHRARRFKKTCFFLLALLACLWLLIPGLCKSFKNDGRYDLPNFGEQPSQTPWPPEKREHREHETFRSITGTYQLYDLLDLSTTSGSITVTIEVQPGDKPAVLRLASQAGSVNVKMTSGGGLFRKRFVSEVAKSRVLQTEISSSAGSVSGNIVHGNGGSASISTNAGSINLDVYTVGVSELDAHSRLSTVTNQGSQHVKVYSDISNTEPIRALEASHTVRGSGSMTIEYPTEWEGMVHMTSYGSGSMAASGRGLVVRKESSHELYGYKGSKEGTKVEIAELGSGSVRFTC